MITPPASSSAIASPIRRHLAAVLQLSKWRVLERLHTLYPRADFPDTNPVAKEQAEVALTSVTTALSAPAPLQTLAERFGLTEGELDLLLLSTALQLDDELAGWLASLHGSTSLTVRLALQLVPTLDWEHLRPEACLRAWRMLEFQANSSPAEMRLHLDERILHFLLGSEHPAEPVAQCVRPLPEPIPLRSSAQALIATIHQGWTAASSFSQFPIYLLEDATPVILGRLALEAMQSVGLPVLLLDAGKFPEDSLSQRELFTLTQREMLLSGAGVILLADRKSLSISQSQAINHWMEASGGALIICSQTWQCPPSNVTRLSLPTTAAHERESILRELLGEQAGSLNGDLAAIAQQFPLEEETLTAICRNHPIDQLRQACRRAARHRLEPLATRIESRAEWTDLVLPDKQKQTLTRIRSQLHHQRQVLDQWGFAHRSSRGLGLTALFSGPSGTGKTMAAEVLAHALDLDLYRIDLSAVMSKYIGETEKNLASIFDGAEASGAILLFDEADALYGKRTEVKSSHDRHANLEVSYLLQRMEAYSGLAILTTNYKEILDKAFLRRIRFLVDFHFPDLAERHAIWHAVFPPQAPLGNLHCEKLARIPLTGANIRNVALQSAFEAAAQNSPISMSHIAQAMRAEFVKLEKPVNETSLRELNEL